MSRHCTALITRNTGTTGRQVDTRAMPRPHRIPPAIPTASAADRYSLIWFCKVAVLWFAASAVAGLALAYWGR